MVIEPRRTLTIINRFDKYMSHHLGNCFGPPGEESACARHPIDVRVSQDARSADDLTIGQRWQNIKIARATRKIKANCPIRGVPNREYGLFR
jgi:hypothetical protein